MVIVMKSSAVALIMPTLPGMALPSPMWDCCHYRNQEQFCLGDLRKQSFEEILNSLTRLEVIERVKLANCLPGCRGDHVNRQVI